MERFLMFYHLPFRIYNRADGDINVLIDISGNGYDYNREVLVEREETKDIDFGVGVMTEETTSADVTVTVSYYYNSDTTDEDHVGISGSEPFETSFVVYGVFEPTPVIDVQGGISLQWWS